MVFSRNFVHRLNLEEHVPSLEGEGLIFTFLMLHNACIENITEFYCFWIIWNPSNTTKIVGKIEMSKQRMAALLITDLNFIRAVYQQLGISMMSWCLVILKKNLNPVFSFTEREACYLKVISNSSNHDVDSNSGLLAYQLHPRLPNRHRPPPLWLLWKFVRSWENRGVYTVYCSNLVQNEPLSVMS